MQQRVAVSMRLEDKRQSVEASSDGLPPLEIQSQRLTKELNQASRAYRLLVEKTGKYAEKSVPTVESAIQILPLNPQHVERVSSAVDEWAQRLYHFLAARAEEVFVQFTDAMQQIDTQYRNQSTQLHTSQQSFKDELHSAACQAELSSQKQREEINDRMAVLMKFTTDEGNRKHDEYTTLMHNLIQHNQNLHHKQQLDFTSQFATEIEQHNQLYSSDLQLSQDLTHTTQKSKLVQQQILNSQDKLNALRDEFDVLNSSVQSKGNSLMGEMRMLRDEIRVSKGIYNKKLRHLMRCFNATFGKFQKIEELAQKISKRDSICKKIENELVGIYLVSGVYSAIPQISENADLFERCNKYSHELKHLSQLRDTMEKDEMDLESVRTKLRDFELTHDENSISRLLCGSFSRCSRILTTSSRIASCEDSSEHHACIEAAIHIQSILPQLRPLEYV